MGTRSLPAAAAAAPRRRSPCCARALLRRRNRAYALRRRALVGLSSSCEASGRHTARKGSSHGRRRGGGGESAGMAAGPARRPPQPPRHKRGRPGGALCLWPRPALRRPARAHLAAVAPGSRLHSSSCRRVVGRRRGARSACHQCRRRFRGCQRLASGRRRRRRRRPCRSRRLPLPAELPARRSRRGRSAAARAVRGGAGGCSPGGPRAQAPAEQVRAARGAPPTASTTAASPIRA
jgi:hypothetical protein